VCSSDLGLANKPGGFTDEDARIAAAFGELAAIALRNSRNLEALEGTEEKDRAVMENIDEVVMFTDPSGKITHLNPACKELLGYSPEELVGRPLGVIHPEDMDKVRDAFARAAGGKTKTDVKCRILTRSGESRTVSHSWLPIMKGQKVQSVMGIMRKIPGPR